MGFAHITKHVDERPEAIFEVAADTRRLPQWLTLIVEVADESDRLDHEGASFDALLKLGDRRLETSWQVTRTNPPRSTHLEGSAPDGGTASLQFEVGAWEGGAEVVFEIDWDLPGGFVDTIRDKLFVERLIARELRHSVTNLADIVDFERDANADSPPI